MKGNDRRPDPASPGDGAVLADAEAGRRDGAAGLTLEQAFDSGTLYALRAAVQAHATEAGLPESRTDDLVIAVHELAANAVRHGAGAGRLRMWERDGALHCQVDDSGSPAAAGDAGPDGNVAERWPFLPGHGLWLVRLVADQISVFSGPAGTCATVVFSSGQDPSASASDLSAALGAGRAAIMLSIVSLLKASVAAGESGPVVVLSGEADLASAGELSDLLTAQLAGGVQRLMVDLSGLRFADSASVRALVLAGRTLRERGGELVLARPQRAVARVLELMGVDQLLVVQGGAGPDSLEAAELRRPAQSVRDPAGGAERVGDAEKEQAPSADPEDGSAGPVGDRDAREHQAALPHRDPVVAVAFHLVAGSQPTAEDRGDLAGSDVLARYLHFRHDPQVSPAPQRACRRPQAATGGWSVPQYLHLEAAAGRSLDRQAGQVLRGGGSPNTTWPRRAWTVL
jgi:anti-anti-sigma factor